MNEKIQAAFEDELRKIGTIKKKIQAVGSSVKKSGQTFGNVLADAGVRAPVRAILATGGAAKKGAKKILKRFKK